jgi:pimeloyl-ACP methyl ester carboxylesterase
MYVTKVSKLFYCCLFASIVFINNANSQVNYRLQIPGILVDAGGHKLHLNILGKGSPTVIFENGSGDLSFIWDLVQPEISKLTKTVSYDRAGYAWSEPGPTPRTSRQICFELYTALHNAGINDPYLLVGQSFGGFLVRAFARFYPKDVVGMVLVEAVQEDQRIFMGGDSPKRIREFAKARKEPTIQKHFKPESEVFGDKVKLDSTIEFPLNKLANNIQRMQLWAQSQSTYKAAVSAEMDWSPEDVANVYNHKDDPYYKLGSIPLIILSRRKGGYDVRTDSLELETERLNRQRELANLSVNNKHIIDNSGHNIHLEDPVAVIKAIKDVFMAAKNHKKMR